MSKKYNKYTKTSPCNDLLKSVYAQCIINIINDDESFITEEMKVEFFEHMQNFKTGEDIVEYCNTFFNQPKGSDFATKKYLLKGKVVADGIYKKNIGRVASRNGLRWNLNSAIIKSFASRSVGPSPISDVGDESIIDLFSVDYEDATDCNLFRNFIEDSKVENCLIQPSIMWTFEAYYDDDVFMGYELKDLPCILGLPGSDGTSKNYDTTERLAFSMQIPYSITVRKPTSFDAQMMPVWRPGGKTKPHTECVAKFGNTGFDEYVHEPVTLKQITSQFYRIKK